MNNAEAVKAPLKETELLARSFPDQGMNGELDALRLISDLIEGGGS